jgi:uncharacterized 2Fe-2S/4Fe-4S cluster protein (DUF4445 family)
MNEGISGFEVSFQTDDGACATVRVREGETILNAAKKAGIPIDAPCSGNGTCGKCKVKVLSGQVAVEGNKHLSDDEIAEGHRLACMSVITGDLTIAVPESALAYQSRIRVGDMDNLIQNPAFQSLCGRFAQKPLKSDVKLLDVHLSPPDTDDARADSERLLRAAADKLGDRNADVTISLSALRKLPHVLRESDFSISCVLREQAGVPHIIDVHAEPAPPLGLAIDIGTTTVSALLTDLSAAEPIASGSAGNGQIRYGADVINRLIESAKPGGVERLREAVADECIAPLVRRLCESAGRKPEDIYRTSIAGNTTMAHLLLGVYGNNLRMEPYVPAFFSADSLKGADLGIGVHPDGAVVLAPSVGSYVGGDITAGILASDIHRGKGVSLFIDLGTNGELVLGGADFLLSCACSAGPACEGGEISCGMRATDGAIESCVIDKATGEPHIGIIGDTGQKPVGICGSGLIDLVGELFRCGIIDARGKFICEEGRVVRDEWGMGSYTVCHSGETATGRAITLNEADIDNFIRAKGSIYSAIRTMLCVTDMSMDMLDGVYIAGGIGSGINIEHAIMTGMLPNVPLDMFHYIGNTSLLGAYAMLISESARSEVSAIAGNMTYMELSSCPGYMDEFIAACFLPHTDRTLFE